MGNTIVKQAPAQQTLTEKDIEVKRENLRSVIQRLQNESDGTGFYLSDYVLHFLEFLQPYPESHPKFCVRALSREDVLQEIATIVLEPHIFLPNYIAAAATGGGSFKEKKRPPWFHERDLQGIHRIALIRNLTFLPVHKRMYVEHDTTEVLVL